MWFGRRLRRPREGARQGRREEGDRAGQAPRHRPGRHPHARPRGGRQLPAARRHARRPEGPAPRRRARRSPPQGVQGPRLRDLARRAVRRADPPRAQADGAGDQELQPRRARPRVGRGPCGGVGRRPRPGPDRRAGRDRPDHLRRQRDREVPLHLGRRPRLVRRQRLRLLGLGELRARRRRPAEVAPGLRRVREVGLAGTGQVGHDLRQRRPRLHVRRRACASTRAAATARSARAGRPRRARSRASRSVTRRACSAASPRLSCRSRARARRAPAATRRAAPRAGRRRPGGSG